MEILQDISIKNDTVNVMLSEVYRGWFTPSEEGEFPPEFHESFGSRMIGVGMEHGIEFYYEDFRGGWQETRRISRETELYRQKYCGCIYSEKERFIEARAKKGGSN